MKFLSNWYRYDYSKSFIIYMNNNNPSYIDYQIEINIQKSLI